MYENLWKMGVVHPLERVTTMKQKSSQWKIKISDGKPERAAMVESCFESLFPSSVCAVRSLGSSSFKSEIKINIV